MTYIKKKIEKWIQLIHRVESQQFQLRIVGLTDNFRNGGKAKYSPHASAFFGIFFSFMCTIYARAYTYDTNLTSVLYGLLSQKYFDIYDLALKDSKIPYEKLNEFLHLLPEGFDNFCIWIFLQVPGGKSLTYAKAVEFVRFVEDGGIEEIMQQIWRDL